MAATVWYTVEEIVLLSWLVFVWATVGCLMRVVVLVVQGLVIVTTSDVVWSCLEIDLTDLVEYDVEQIDLPKSEVGNLASTPERRAIADTVKDVSFMLGSERQDKESEIDWQNECRIS